MGGRECPRLTKPGPCFPRARGKFPPPVRSTAARTVPATWPLGHFPRWFFSWPGSAGVKCFTWNNFERPGIFWPGGFTWNNLCGFFFLGPGNFFPCFTWNISSTSYPLLLITCGQCRGFLVDFLWITYPQPVICLWITRWISFLQRNQLVRGLRTGSRFEATGKVL